jgi:thiol-disulfide isomerase/thioredoxin
VTTTGFEVNKANQKTGQHTAAKRKIPVLPIIFVGVFALLIGAMFIGGSSSQAGEQTGEPVITGESLPQFPNPPPFSPEADPAFGLVAPEVSGQDFAGNPVEIKHDGTPTAIVLLAHWCPHCQAEVPRVTEWLNETGGIEGVDIVSVSSAIDERKTNYPPSSWLERENWPVPIILDDANSSILRAYGNGGFPYWVFLDGEGRVVARTAGQLETPQLEALLIALVGS